MTASILATLAIIALLAFLGWMATLDWTKPAYAYVVIEFRGVAHVLYVGDRDAVLAAVRERAHS